MKELLIDTMVFEVTPTMLAEAKNQHGRFLVNGVLQRANAKKTPQELGEDERFEDDPRALKEIEYGRVVRKPTTMTYAMKKGDVFND